jgi:hypothetical protein
MYADVAVLDGLEKHFQLVGVPGALGFRGLPGLELLDRLSDHVPGWAWQVRGLIFGDLLRVGFG